jgi:hypothetical protein
VSGDGGPVYVSSYDVTLAAAASSQSFGADSLSTGSAGNAPAGVFTRHNFSNYADSRYGTLHTRVLSCAEHENLAHGRDSAAASSVPLTRSQAGDRSALCD